MSNLGETLRAKARSLLASIGHGPVSATALALFRRPERREESVSVHMLVSEKTWHAGLLAIASFEFHTGRQWEICLHDDGSISPESREKILRFVPGIRFITRREADQQTGEFLAGHPRCLSNRSRHNLFLKFFDTMAYVRKRRFIVLDSDVIFFRPPAELLAWVDTGAETCLYNEDTREKYCISREEIEKSLPVTLLPRFNSGLVLMQKEAMSLDLAERLIQPFENSAYAPQFFEQTLYALMASANPGGGGALPRTYNISWGYWRDPGSICRHYVGHFKHDLLYIEGVPCLLGAMLRRKLTGGG